MKKKLGPVLNTRLGPVLTLETPNLGPVFNSTAYIYLSLYAGGLVRGPMEKAFMS